LDVGVYSGSPGALSLVACGQGGLDDNAGVFMEVASGTTYWIMVTPGCCIQSIILNLSVYRDVSPRATMSVTSATVDQGGNVTVSGTLDCNGPAPGGVVIKGTIRQPVGRLHSVTAHYTADTVCDRTQQWTALAQPHAGKFVVGHTDATIDAATNVCNLVGCASVSTTKVIRLTR
jgi:hypothetical protein